MIRNPLHLLVLAVASALPAQVLLMTNATSDTLVSIDPTNGAVINASLFPIANTTMVSAIDVNGEVWISEQLTDRITRYDINGTVLGVIGPTFAGGGLDNIRGMAFVNGTVYVSNSGTANGAPGNAVVTFDPAGNFLSSWTTNTLATSPFAVMPFQGDLLVSGSSNANDIHRFDLAGAPIGVFHNSTGISFAHQIAPASDGNVWCAGFTTGGISKIDATTGLVLSSFPAAGARGVHELANGNVLWSNGSGLWLYDIVGATSSQLLTGSCYHINLYGAGGGTPASATAFGTACDGLTYSASGLPQIGNASFALPAISPVGLFAFGSAAVSPGIDLTVIGMAGCFSYTSFDLGLFSGSAVTAGTSTFSLPVPNSPSLVGSTLGTQGVSFSLTTSLLLASSNGIALTLGN